MNLDSSITRLQTLNYEQLREFKRQLKQGPNAIEAYRKVREYYYRNFAASHMLRNLEQKRKIPALDIQVTFFNDSKEETENIGSQVKAMKEALADNPTITQITWCHGTQSPTIPGVMNSGQEFKPSGVLRQENRIPFCGENRKGAAGINRENLSGVTIESAETAIAYAKGGLGYNDEWCDIAVHAPKETITWITEEDEDNEFLKGWLEKFKSEQFDDNDVIHDLNKKYTIWTNLYNFHRMIKILWTLEPELFESKILPIIKELVEVLEGRLEKIENLEELKKQLKEKESELEAGVEEYDRLEELLEEQPTLKELLSQLDENLWKLDDECEALKNRVRRVSYKHEMLTFLNSEVFAAILSFKETLPVYSDRDKAAIRNLYPVVIATNSIAIHMFRNRRSGFEHLYKGNMKLGKDIQFLFVPLTKVGDLKEYLTPHQQTGVKVVNMATLKLVSLIPTFQKKKIQ